MSEADVPDGGLRFEMGGRIGEDAFVRCTISYAPGTGCLQRVRFEDYTKA